MTDDRFEELLGALPEEHNAPPATPSAEIWAKLQANRATAEPARRSPLVRPIFWWPLAAAALLLLGVQLGRMSKPTPLTTARPDTAKPGQKRADPYAILAAQHLDRAETLLTHFENGNDPTLSKSQITDWARDLLGDTRLLLDSPAIDQPATRDLLSDVELLLALIVQMDDSDPNAIAQGLRRSGLLQRLRARIPAESV